MTELSFPIDGLDSPCLFFQNDASRRLFVFLPSVRSKPIYPYYPRINWATQFAATCNVLYVADPFQDMPFCQKEGGSWFVSPQGHSVLPQLGDWIASLARDRNCTEIVLYGSSMGGYAGIVLSHYVGPCRVFAECPQLYLDRHPGSRDVVNKACGGVLRNVPTPLEALLAASADSIFNIVLSLHDHHYETHTLPFLVELKMQPAAAVVNVVLYSNNDYAKGHVALSFEDAWKLVQAQLPMLSDVSKQRSLTR